MTHRRDSVPDEVAGKEKDKHTDDEDGEAPASTSKTWSDVIIPPEGYPSADDLPDSVIDRGTFDQLLEMDDDDDDHDFSKGIVEDYFKQADMTFKDMDTALDKEELQELSRLGHFLKGSSAAIGLKKVKATCEKIQNIGKCEVDGKVLEKKDALKEITPLLPQVRKENAEAKEHLSCYYKTDG